MVHAAPGIDRQASIALLLERLETAKEGSRELDAAIECVARKRIVHGALPAGFTMDDQGSALANSRLAQAHYITRSRGPAPRYTVSLDAALMLVPEGFSKEITESAAPPAPYFTRVRLWDWRRGPLAIDPANEWKSEGNRPLPLALCIAALKARAQI